MVSQDQVAGELLELATRVPSTSNSMLVTPTLSEPLRFMEAVPVRVAPDVGAEMATVGAVLSPPENAIAASTAL